MARNFPDFLSAYRDYSLDGFVPDRFHEWVGRSIVASALERKVTLKQGRIHHCPNIYVMLVSHPGSGKSTAIEAGTDLIEAVKKEYNPGLKIIPNQVTEAALIDLMKITERIALTPTVLYPHSSAYFYASEASASALQNTCGDFVAAMTAFYDCPKWFRKKLKGEQFPTEIENSCMNLLAGATFNYLKTLVNEQSVLGGFASRLIYVVETERQVRRTKWGSSREFDSSLGRKLVEDLAQINTLVGPMTPTPGFMARFEEWQPQFDEFLIALKSERMESIMSRKGTNLIKLAMILSVSEGNSLSVTEKHFDRALAEIEDCYKDNSEIIIQAALANKSSQDGVNHLIIETLKKNNGEMDHIALKQVVYSRGNDIAKVKETVEALLEARVLSLDATSGRIKLLVNAHTYL